MAQIDKNTVEAINQLKNKFVFVNEKDNADVRIMFVGNSITLHGVKEDIGWHNSWGMAASSKENDYVHRIVKQLEKFGKRVSYCICQVSVWETKYKNGSEILDTYKLARDFGADVIIMRCIENCPGTDFDGNIFEKEYKNLISYLNSNDAKIIVTTGFWHHPGDNNVKSVANSLKAPCICLGDLGEDDKMMAKGLFEHEGVAMHPGDLGMENIAERIFNAIKNEI